MDSLQELIGRAGGIIGAADKDDYVIHPTLHAERYADDAPALADILRSSRVIAKAEEYERQDALAIQAQKHFKAIAYRTNIAILLTVLFGILVLVTNALDRIGDARRAFLIALGIAGAVSGGLAAMWLYWIDKSRLLQKWMSARADAETQRLAYFEAVTNQSGSDAHRSALPLALLQLEYFLRYQMQVQMKYYDMSTTRHESSASAALRIGCCAVFISCIFTGISGFVHPLLAAMGVLAAALSSFANGREGINQDRRNAERYERTRKALQALKAEIDEVRRAAARGQLDPVKKFVAAVHEQLSLEHRQWLETEDYIGQALQSLRDSLAKLRSGE